MTVSVNMSPLIGFISLIRCYLEELIRTAHNSPIDRMSFKLPLPITRLLSQQTHFLQLFVDVASSMLDVSATGLRAAVLSPAGWNFVLGHQGEDQLAKVHRV